MLEINDVLSPEFQDFAVKVKAVYDNKQKELQVFRDLYARHKQKVAEFDKSAADLIAAYKNSKVDTNKQDESQCGTK